MLKVLFYLFLLVMTMALGMWLFQSPGHVSFEWANYALEGPAALFIGILVLLVLVISFLLVCFDRVWRSFRYRRFQTQLKYLEKEKEYFIEGMVAIASRDYGAALKASKTLIQKYPDSPLALLLASRTSHFSGEEETGHYFHRMLENKALRFLGLRQLSQEAIKNKLYHVAAKHLSKASEERPQSPLVWEYRFYVDLKQGHFAHAYQSLEKWVSTSKMDEGHEGHLYSILRFEQAKANALKSNEAECVLLKGALKDDPLFLPAVEMYAHYCLQDKKNKRLQRVIEKVWREKPYLPLIDIYLKSFKNEGAMGDYKRLEKLTATHPEHWVSHYALARKALEAHLWGLARRHIKNTLTLMSCPLTLELAYEIRLEEESEPAVLVHLIKESEKRLSDDPAWVCGHCHARVTEWEAFCPSCDQFDTFSWGSFTSTPSSPSLITQDMPPS